MNRYDLLEYDLEKEVLDRQLEVSAKYDDVRDYINDTGWEDWMENLVEDGDELSERDCKKIDKILKMIYKEAHKGDNNEH